METSIFLAKVIGLFGTNYFLQSFLLQSTSCDGKDMQKVLLWFICQVFLFLLLGVLVTVSHPVWVFSWPVVITILGWLLLLKGVMRIFFPDLIKNLIEKKKSIKRFILAEMVSLLISLYLLYQGFVAN